MRTNYKPDCIVLQLYVKRSVVCCCYSLCSSWLELFGLFPVLWFAAHLSSIQRATGLGKIIKSHAAHILESRPDWFHRDANGTEMAACLLFFKSIFFCWFCKNASDFKTIWPPGSFADMQAILYLESIAINQWAGKRWGWVAVAQPDGDGKSKLCVMAESMSSDSPVE